MSEYRQYEDIIESATEDLEQYEALERLKLNKDFKKVFFEQYMTYQAAEFVRKKADPSLQSKESQEYINGQINSIGHLAQYFSNVVATGRTAPRRIEAAKSNILALDQANEEGEE